MEQQLSPTSPSPETGPVKRSGEVSQPVRGDEHAPGIVPEQAPASPEKGGEQHVQSTGGDPSFTAPTTPLPPLVQPTTVQPPVQTVPIDDTPLIAADEEVIEQEWVQKAKKIVEDTKYDPYLQEREVSKLQAAYLKKRYDKDVKLPEE